MKKIVITALIVLSISSVTKAYAFDDAALTPYTMDTMFDNFYESPLTMPVVETQDEPKVINNGPQASYYPLFKRARIKITNFFRARENARLEKQQAKQLAELEEEDKADEEAAQILEEFNQQALNKDNSNVQKAKVEENVAEGQAENQTIDENPENAGETIELSGGVQEQKVENEVGS